MEPDGAEVLATDAHGRPALLLRAIGEGAMVLCTYPLEHMAALTPRVNPNDLVTLYDALAAHAAVDRPLTVADPRVCADALRHQDGRRFVWLVSEAGQELTVKPALAGGTGLRTLDGERVPTAVTLAPYGVAVFQLTDTAESPADDV